MELKAAIEEATGFKKYALRRLSGGGAAHTFCLSFPDGQELILKGKGKSLDLNIEALSLIYLRDKTNLPVPHVTMATNEYLLIEKMPGETGKLKNAEQDLAQKLQILHQVTWHSYGFEYDTPYSRVWALNTPKATWIEFFRENRLLNTMIKVMDSRKLPVEFVSRIESVADRLNEWIEEPAQPSLLHGDLWHGNILTQDTKVTALIDPALFYGDPEFEFAPATWKKDLTRNFFELYFSDRGGIPDGFSMRQRVYHLYPILAYIYVSKKPKFKQLDTLLKKLGA